MLGKFRLSPLKIIHKAHKSLENSIPNNASPDISK